MTVTFRMEDESHLSNFLLQGLQLDVTMGVFYVLCDLLELPPSPSCGRIEAGVMWDKAVRGMHELNTHGQEWTRSEEPARELEGSSMRVMPTPALELEPLIHCVNRLNVIAHCAFQRKTAVIWS